MRSSNDIKRAAIAGEPAAGRLKPQSVASIAGSIRRFSCWLSEKKQGIVVRPHDASLNEDAKLYKLKCGDRKIFDGLTHLRNFMLGTRALEVLRPQLAPYSEDAALIQKAAEAARAGIASGTPWQGSEKPYSVSRAATMLRKFSKWLQTQHMSAIAGRLDDHSLQEDGKEFRRVRNSHSLRIELKLLWTYNSLRGSPAATISENDLDLLESWSRRWK
ncbi:hypothetical protein [Bradyrhizobium sp. RDI18]|uniref:hypothetical protein n=1 Tax=Bradyrhizobium sp. RDI18 TaxID=3367400 RepID=UPI0037194858